MTSWITPILSVVVPVYNTGKYIPRCIESIINQSFKDLEIIIVNDCSDDNSQSVIEFYAAQNPNIKSLQTAQRSGVGGARNMGLLQARGKFIGFVDSDDWIDSTFYQKSISILQKSNADMGVCGVMKEYESPFDVFYKYNYDLENIIDGMFALELLTHRINQDIAISPSACNKVYKASFLAEHNLSFLSGNYNEDDLFTYQCFLYARSVAIIPSTYYHYYQRMNSTTHHFSKKHIDDLLEVFSLLKNLLEDKNLFQVHRNNYYAYLEKCLSFVLNLMIQHEQSIEQQNKYLMYLLEKASDKIKLADYFDYCGVHRLRYFLHPSPIR